MIYECTDCSHCANFDFGFRIFCLHPKLLSDEVCKYFPVGDRDAEDCSGFDVGEPEHFSMKQLEQAEEYSKNKYDDTTYYEGIREWCWAQNEKKEGEK